ncbi:MAG: hypothetical protein WCH65_03980 [bacterium]
MKKHKVVIGGSTVTAGQLKDLFRMIDDGTVGYPEMEKFLETSTSPSSWVSTEQLEVLSLKIKDNVITFEKLQNFLEKPQRDVLLKYPSYVRAINILGNENVLTVQSIYRLWNIPYSLEERHTLDKIRYSEATLRKCAIENKRHQASWYLIYVIGMTLPEQRKILGIDIKNEPCFRSNYDWFLDEKEKFWADKKPTNGDYYLINYHDFGTYFGTYSEQLRKVEALGPEYAVLDPHIFMEATISRIIKADSMPIYLWYHRSLVKDYKGDYVCIGCFNDGSLQVKALSSDSTHPYLRMVTYKKHDF